MKAAAKEVTYATQWSQARKQAGPAIRAHQGQREAAGHVRGPRRGDRRTDGQQGTRPLRRVSYPLAHLDARHVLLAPRRPALRHQPGEGPHARSALSGGSQARDRRPLEDDQGAAAASGRRREVLALPRSPTSQQPLSRAALTPAVSYASELECWCPSRTS